jgi:hypothetical protein
MQSSYAVYWNEGEGLRHAGRFELERDHAQLVGQTRNGTRRLVWIFFGEIVSVRYGYGRLRVERRARPALEVGSVDRPGALRELAERLQAAALPV